MEILKPSRVEHVQEHLRRIGGLGGKVSVYRPVSNGDYRLDFSDLNAIEEIDAANLVAVVQPGVNLGRLREKLNELGLRFVPAQSDFVENMSIGEFYCTGAPFVYSLKYGAAKHFLMGAELVLGSGELLKTGGRTVKNVTGYDLTRFMVAPFTSFGVAVRLNLKLLPAAEASRAGVAAFGSLERVFAFVDSLRAARLVPACLLWIDPMTRALLGGESAGGEHLVLFELDGTVEEVDRQAERIRALLANTSGTLLGDSEGQALRRSLRGVFSPEGGFSLVGEFSARQAELKSLLDRLAGWAMDKSLGLGLFGQIAEGKFGLRLPGTPQEKAPLVRELSELVRSSGGYVSGKFARMVGMEPEEPLAVAEKEMKRRFDPAGVLEG